MKVFVVDGAAAGAVQIDSAGGIFARLSIAFVAKGIVRNNFDRWYVFYTARIYGF